MVDEETDIWLEALSGRAPNDPRASAREAHALRAAVLRRPRLDTGGAEPRDAAREDELLERARRAGLVPVRRRRPGWGWSRLSSWPAAAALIAVACVAVVTVVSFRATRETGIVRGAPEAIVTLHASDPAALKREILDELRAAGVHATGYERLGAQGIDADLPQPVPDRVRAVLARHHIEVPRDGVLQIAITGAPAP